MGRGRAKAKQTKVARDLKYRSHETDFGALARELHGDERDEGNDGKVDDTKDADAADPVDEYDDWADYSESPSRD
jgi:hypothetical protein